MRYNPDINPKAYAPHLLYQRLATLTKLENDQRAPRSVARAQELAAIKDHLEARAPRAQNGPPPRLVRYDSRQAYNARRR